MEGTGRQKKKGQKKASRWRGSYEEDYHSLVEKPPGGTRCLGACCTDSGVLGSGVLSLLRGLPFRSAGDAKESLGLPRQRFTGLYNLNLIQPKERVHKV